MARGFGIFLAAAALAGCSPKHPEPGIPSPAGLESVSVQTNSWGKPVTDWTLARSGEGRYSFSRDVEGGTFHDYDFVTKRVAGSAADFAEVAGLLDRARAHAGGEIPCRHEISDGIYGRIAWTEAGETKEVKFNFGCLSAEANLIYRRLYGAQGHVKALAEKGEVLEIREVRRPHG